jgi:hypothetical protein
MNRQPMPRSKRVFALLIRGDRRALSLPAHYRYLYLMAGIVAIWLNVASGQASAAPFRLYATQFQFDASFYSVDPSSGAATVIGNTDSDVPGLAFRRSNGVLYGSSGDLDTINVKTGLATKIVSFPELMISIAFSPTDELYALNNGSSSGKLLYTVDPATGSALASVMITGTVFPTTGSPFPNELEGIAFGPNGTLYGIGAGLYSINPLTGAATRITPAGKYVDAVNDIFLNIDLDPTACCAV